MEIIARKNGKTLWIGRNCEGKKVYAVTNDRDGVACYPEAATAHTMKAAWAQDAQDSQNQ